MTSESTPPKRSKSFLDRIRPRSRSPSPDGHSRTACSSDVFNMFKTLALASSTSPLTTRASSEYEHSMPPTPETDSPSADSPSEGSPLPTPVDGSTMRLDTASSIPTPEAEAEPSKEEKIAAIQEEFGDIASVMEDEGGHTAPEVMLAESSGAMFKGVMLVGNIHLTTHRLLFHALLPPDEAFTRHYDSAEDFETLGSASTDPSVVLHSGPVTWHRHKLPSTRVWMELSPDMIATYPSANETGRVRPIKSILLNSVDGLRPPDEAKPSDIYLIHAHSTYHFTVDTPQSAAQWRRNIEAALFRVLRLRWLNGFFTRRGQQPESKIDKWNTLRYCVPLDRLTVKAVGDYHGFATLVSLQVALDKPRKTILPMDLGLHVIPDSSPAVDTDLIFNFNIAVITEQALFIEQLHSAVLLAHQRRLRDGVPLPLMTFSVAGLDFLAEDGDFIEGRPESIHAKLARKAERAHLAAKAFGLHEEEGMWLKRCYVEINGIPVRGHLILTPRFVCFWRRNVLTPDVKYRFNISIVKGFEAVPCIQPGFSGLALKLHGQHDVIFEFWDKSGREEAIERMDEVLARSSPAPSHPFNPLPTSEPHPADILAPSKKALFQTRVLPDDFLSHMPFIANRPWMSKSVALSPRTFTLLTIGSRGDVQPYIALGLRLKQDGHRVIIVTHDEFKDWIQGYGLEHRQTGGDPTALMTLSAEHKMLSPGFFKESIGYFRGWLDNLLIDSWEACKDADVLIESPSTMAGIHIAEKLQIPYFRAFTMPWTRTHEYPQAFMVPAFEMGPSFNYSTYVIYDNIIWKATAGQINRWRKDYLGLGSTDMSAMSITKVPFLYNFSSSVVPKPLDWHTDISITGYWTLEDSDKDWSPPADLEVFMAKAKADGKALVYIGFGSIVVPKPSEMTTAIIEGVEKADVRAIIAKGWSSRGGTHDPVEYPASCYGLDKVPHGWLFPKVAAAMHHGGAGTVGASLRAGLPILIKPYFGDQHFWANRVTKLGVGLRIPSLRSSDIAEALVKATTDRVMIEKAARIGEAIRKENGVDNAVEAIHYNILRAGGDRRKLAWGK